MLSTIMNGLSHLLSPSSLACCRAAQAAREAALAATAFEQQLAELEAAASAAEAVVQEGTESLAAGQQQNHHHQQHHQHQHRQQHQHQQHNQHQHQQQQKSEGQRGDGLGDLPPELLELIDAFERRVVDDAKTAASPVSPAAVTSGVTASGDTGSSGRSSSTASRDGNGTVVNGCSGAIAAAAAAFEGMSSGADVDAAEAALEREMERLRQLQVDGNCASGGAMAVAERLCRRTVPRQRMLFLQSTATRLSCPTK